MNFQNKEYAKDGWEQDWTTKWRHLYCYTKRSGVGKSIKRKMNKRFRRKNKEEIRRSLDEIQIRA